MNNDCKYGIDLGNDEAERHASQQPIIKLTGLTENEIEELKG